MPSPEPAQSHVHAARPEPSAGHDHAHHHDHGNHRHTPPRRLAALAAGFHAVNLLHMSVAGRLTWAAGLTVFVWLLIAAVLA